MSWQRRLAELMAAGGALASLSGCPAIFPGGCGNANPDPCVCDRTPASSPQCVAEATCEDNGGSWDLYPPVTVVDAGAGSGSDAIRGRCEGYPLDAGPVLDASGHLDAVPDSSVLPDARVLDAH